MGIIKELTTFIDNFSSQSIEIVDGLTFNAKDLIKTIEYYTNSKYLNGQEDTQGRHKNFYNILNFRVNVATRATDFDTKDFHVISDNPNHYIKSMIFNKELQVWMRKVNFAKTLNEFGFTRAKYGGVILKRVKKDGELQIEIPEWKNIIFDPADLNGTKAEKHYLTPIDIFEKKGVWNKLDENYAEVEKAFEKQENYNSTTRLCVLEVEGVFENEYIDEEEEGYSLQKHIVLMVDGTPYCELHSEKLKDSNYMYLDWLKASGRGLGIGVVEDGIEAQIATNDAILKQRDILEAASKVVFVHNSDEIAQVENITQVDFGHFFKIGLNESMSLLNQTPNSLPQLNNIIQQWDDQVSKATSTFEAITGETMPSGTPFRAIAVQNQEATSLFNYRKEEAGIFWKDVFKKWIIPHLRSKLTSKHFLAGNYTDAELQIIDKAFTTKKANEEVEKQFLKGKPMTRKEYEDYQKAQKTLLEQGVADQRFLEIPDGYFKNVEFELDLLTTGEQINKSAVFESISNIITTVAQNPAILEDPRLQKLFAKIIELSNIGISPEIFMQTPEKTLPQVTQEVQLQQEAMSQPNQNAESPQPVL